MGEEPGQSPKILAIDDRRDDLTLLASLLASAFPAARLLTALYGARGIELALAEDPDVILLDAVMPAMDGFEVCRRLKADERVQHIPVVFATGGETSRESRIRALEAGGEAFLTKPFDEVELRAQMQAMARVKAGRVAGRRETQRLAAMVLERTAELERELGAHRKAEEELRRAHAELSASYAAAPVALLLVDRDCSVARLNDAAARLAGRTAEETIGLQAGQALQCVHALDAADGCGYGPECAACPVRRAILDTFAGRQGRDQVEAAVPTAGDPGRCLLVSTAYLEWDGEGKVLIGAHDITSRKRAEEAQRASDARYRALFENMLDGFAHCRMLYDEAGRPVDFVYLEVNPRFERLTGLREVVGKRVTEVIPGVREAAPELFEIYGRVASGGAPESFEIDFKPLSRWLSVSVYGAGEGHFVAVFEDISERKLNEADRETMLTLLRLANAANSTRELIQAVTSELRAWAGCEAVGIRLRDGDDFPYFETRGFPGEFVEAERYLCVRDAAGDVARDFAGNPVLECMCGNILCGRFDPRQPFFTQGGSFWTNCTTRLLATTSEADRQARTRNRCNGEGYESVALIPLRAAGRTLGLLQLNDRRPDRFTPEKIALLERAAASLAIALEQRTTQAALRESAALLRKSGEVAHFGGWSVDLAGQRCLWSDEVAAIHEAPPGFSPSVTDAIAFYPPPWKERIEAVFGACAREGTPFDVEMEIVTARGNRRWVRAIGEAERDGSGAIVRVQGAFQDITSRKESEQALRDSEARFRLLVESSPDAILVQTEGRVAYLNRAAVRLFGATAPEQLLGTPVLDRYPPDRIGLGRERIRAVNEERSPVPTIEQVYLRLDGSPVAVESSAVPIHYRGCDGALVFIRDIGARIRAAGEREKLREQLVQAQKMESIGRLAGGVAHDFNNLLTVINGYSKMMLAKVGVADPLRGPLEEVHKAGERAAGLTQQLLAFSRKQMLQPRVLDLNRVVSGMRPMLERIMGEDVELRIELHPEPTAIAADPHQLEQVVMNLAVNARDAMPHGGTLTMSTSVTERAETAAGYAVLAVRDTGVGMDEETRLRIFEPFFTTKGVGKGTGLGLPMIQGIVEQSGGYIEVESEPGLGTTFRVYLPVTVLPLAEAALPEGAAARGARATLLVVEDQAEVRKFVTTALEAYGFEVIEARSAAEALRFCERPDAVIDLVLTDVVMPNMGGRELARRLAACRPGVKVLFMSGYANPAAIEAAGPEQAVEFIQKPFSPDDLARKIQEMLAPK